MFVSTPGPGRRVDKNLCLELVAVLLHLTPSSYCRSMEPPTNGLPSLPKTPDTLTRCDLKGSPFWLVHLLPTLSDSVLNLRTVCG